MKNLKILHRTALKKVCSERIFRIAGIGVFLLLLTVYSAFCSFSELPQQIKITGKVSDVNGTPLPGVTVVIKGTSTGTVTGSDGAFQLEIPKDAQILQFSFMGMKTQEISIEGNTSFTITMEEEAIGCGKIIYPEGC